MRTLTRLLALCCVVLGVPRLEAQQPVVGTVRDTARWRRSNILPASPARYTLELIQPRRETHHEQRLET